MFQRMLNYRVIRGAFDEVAGWIVGVVLLGCCTLLTVLMIPELRRTTAAVIAACVATAWGVLGWEAWVIGRRLAARRRE